MAVQSHPPGSLFRRRHNNHTAQAPPIPPTQRDIRAPQWDRLEYIHRSHYIFVHRFGATIQIRPRFCLSSCAYSLSDSTCTIPLQACTRHDEPLPIYLSNSIREKRDPVIQLAEVGRTSLRIEVGIGALERWPRRGADVPGQDINYSKTVTARQLQQSSYSKAMVRSNSSSTMTIWWRLNSIAPPVSSSRKAVLIVWGVVAR
jgi:hypothetical protein